MMMMETFVCCLLLVSLLFVSLFVCFLLGWFWVADFHFSLLFVPFPSFFFLLFLSFIDVIIAQSKIYFYSCFFWLRNFGMFFSLLFLFWLWFLIAQSRKQSQKKKKVISKERFRSSDLWVMGPTRFPCATLLFQLFFLFFLWVIIPLHEGMQSNMCYAIIQCAWCNHAILTNDFDWMRK